MEKEFDYVSWNELKTKIKQNYPQLTNADLNFRYGKEEDLIIQIANTLVITRKELREVIAGFES
jgi:hypothetical protein